MIVKDLKVGWRVLLADPGYTAVVVLGLSFAIASVVLLVAYLDSALRSDSDVPDARQVVRLEQLTHTPGADKNWIPDSPMVFFDNWKSTGAPFASATRYYTRDMSVKSGSRIFLEKISFVDPSITDVFGLHAVAGNLADALEHPDTVAVSESAAKRLFASESAMDKTLQIAGKLVTIRAVVPDRRSGSVIATNILINVTSPIMPEPFRLKFWFSIRGENFVRLLPGAAPAQFAERAQAYFDQTPAVRELPPAYGKIASFRATRLPDIPLSGAGSGAVRSLVAGLGISCFIITLLAAINYVNLSVVRIIARQREIGIRKALGASPSRIAKQFLAESVVVVLIASLLGLLVAWIAAPLVGDWLNASLRQTLFTPGKIAMVLVSGMVIALLAGVYPAWVALNVDSSQSLAGRGNPETRSGSWLRRTLTVLQFGAAMALISVTVVILWQTLHASQANLGYDTAPLLAIDAPVDMRDQRLLALRDAIAHLPGVRAVGLSWDVPGRFRRNTSTSMSTGNGQSILLALFEAGPEFFQSYDVKPLAGRVFDPELDKQGTEQLVVINSQAVRQLGFENAQDAVGRKQRMDDQTVEIIGVVPDIRLRSLHDTVGGVAYTIGETNGVSVLSVRSADPRRAMQDVRALWPNYFPDDLLQMEPVQPQLERLYDDERRLGKLIGAGSFVALALAGFGLYALSAYNVRRRQKEFVLRKLHGAGRIDVGVLLGREIVAALLVGALIGLPVGGWLGQQYLASYVDRAPALVWSLFVALVAVALMAVLAAARHTWTALAMSPDKVLRM